MNSFNRSDITCLIIAKNEEKNILRAIQSAIPVCKEVIVVDGGSKDNTVAIAQAFGARVEYREFDNFMEQRKFALSLVRTVWVLGLDADEEIDSDLKKTLEKNTEWNASGYMILRKNIYNNKKLKYLWQNDWQLRFFMTEYAKVSERIVHEGYEVKGRVDNLTYGAILHRPYRDISHYINKINHYTELECIGLAEKKRIHSYDLITHPVSEFLRNWIGRRGFLDGHAGFVISVMSSFYNLVLYSKAMHLQKKP